MLSALPPWAAAMLGLPPSPVHGTPVTGSIAEIASRIEGPWGGSAARQDVGMHKAAQPLTVVLAWDASKMQVFGGGYSAWPAANASGAFCMLLWAYETRDTCTLFVCARRCTVGLPLNFHSLLFLGFIAKITLTK